MDHVFEREHTDFCVGNQLDRKQTREIALPNARDSTSLDLSLIHISEPTRPY